MCDSPDDDPLATVDPTTWSVNGDTLNFGPSPPAQSVQQAGFLIIARGHFKQDSQRAQETLQTSRKASSITSRSHGLTRERGDSGNF